MTQTAKRLLTLLALALCACLPAGAVERTKVTWGYLSLTSMNWDVYTALDQGFLAEEGLDVSGVRFDAGPTTVQALLNGSVDILTTNTEFMILAIQKGAPLSLVAAEVAGTGFMLMAQPSVRSFDNLRGTNIGTGQMTGGATTMLKLLMARHRLAPGDYHLIALGSSQNRFAALSRNAAAAVLLNPPFDEQAKSLGMRPLGAISEVFNAPLQAFAVRRDWGKQHTDTVVRFLRAVVKASRWLHDPRNHDAAIRILAKALHADPTTLEPAYRTFVGPQNLMGTDLRLTSESIQAYLSILAINANAAQYIDLSYLNKAMER